MIKTELHQKECELHQIDL